jgi:hypothetical protein
VGLRPLACWEFGFEYSWVHGYLSVVSVVCCQVELSVSGRSLVHGSPTDCGVSEYDREASLIRRPRSTGGGGYCVMEERKSYSVHDILSMLPLPTQSRQLHNFRIYVCKIYFNIIFQNKLPHHNQFLVPSANLAVWPSITGFWNTPNTTGHGSYNWNVIRHYEFTVCRISAVVATFPFAQSTWNQPTSVPGSVHTSVLILARFSYC